jgi:hypothetical protein
MARNSALGTSTTSQPIVRARSIASSSDSAAASQAGASEAAKAAEAEARYEEFPDSSAVAGEDAAAASRSSVAGGDAAAASLEDAIGRARATGCDVVEVPRAFLRAIGENDSQAVRILRAAFSHDNDALVRAMSVDFDVAELRAATRQTAGKSLRAGLGTAVGALRGLASRERGLAWADRLERIRRSGRKKNGALAASVDATGVDDERLRAEAVAADSVWERIEAVPSVTTRIALLCDSLVRRAVDDCTMLAPFGSQEPDGKVATVRFETDASAIVDLASFARAIDADESVVAFHVTVNGSLYESAARWLEEHHRDRAAYAWPSGEADERVVAPSMTFSASRLNLYAKCPRRWYYEYLCAAVEEKTTSHAIYGKVFHGALEALHRDVRVPADWVRTEVLDRLLGLLDVAFGQALHEFASQLEYEVLRLRARQVAQHYVRWLYEEAADAPLEIVEVESRQTLTLRGHRFVGFIDRVDRPPGGGPVTIFDYKTGRIEDDPAEYLRQVRSGEEAQLAIYYAMRRAQGDDVARVALVSIRDARAKTWILALDITDDEGKSVVHRADRLGVVRASCSIADLERSLDVLTARCDLMTREGIEHFDVGSDPPCLFCAYAQSCRERPADGERIFAR